VCVCVCVREFNHFLIQCVGEVYATGACVLSDPRPADDERPPWGGRDFATSLVWRPLDRTLAGIPLSDRAAVVLSDGHVLYLSQSILTHGSLHTVTLFSKYIQCVAVSVPRLVG
jgi:hypothetical protein